MGTSGHTEEEQLESLSLRSGNLQELLLLQRLGLECPSDDARLLDLQRQLYDVTTELEFKKAAYAQVVEKARQQDLDLQKKQGQLKAQLQRFQRFVYTNEEKTIRANKRAAADKETCQKFADYLAAVAKASPEFSCVGDVMARFEALASDANNKVALYQRELEALEKEATALSAKAEEAANDAREAAAMGEGEAPHEKETGGERQQKERQGGEKEGAPEGTQLQRRCRDAIELLAAIRYLIADFRDIEEQLNKGEKKKQKAFRTVNLALEKSDEDVVEFVATRVSATTRKDTGSTDISKKTVSRRVAEENSGYYQQSMRIHGLGQ
ncbi:hypothetical protein Emag_003463 [Eimeria magna]